jgi:hypothetical protein
VVEATSDIKYTARVDERTADNAVPIFTANPTESVSHFCKYRLRKERRRCRLFGWSRHSSNHLPRFHIDRNYPDVRDGGMRNPLLRKEKETSLG